MVVILFTLGMGFMGTFYPGMKVNPLDLSPNYAGSLMAVTNGIGALTGIAAPTMVGYLTTNVSFIRFFFFNLDLRKTENDEKKLKTYFSLLICSHHWKNGELFFGFRLQSLLLQRLFIRFGHPVKFNHGMSKKHANHPNPVLRNIIMAMTKSKLILIQNTNPPHTPNQVPNRQAKTSKYSLNVRNIVRILLYQKLGEQNESWESDSSSIVNVVMPANLVLKNLLISETMR